MIGKKRVAGLLLAVCMMVSLCACTSQETTQGTTDDNSIVGTWYFTEDSQIEVSYEAFLYAQVGDSIQFYNDGTFVIEHIDTSRGSYDGEYEMVHDGEAIEIAAYAADFQINGNSLEIYHREGTWYLNRESPVSGG